MGDNQIRYDPRRGFVVEPTSPNVKPAAMEEVGMSRVKLADAVFAKRMTTVETRPALYAMKCDGCARVFDMAAYCNDTGLGQLHGTFKDGTRSMGNGFTATACSFKCAHDLFAKEGWKLMPKYSEFVALEIPLVRCELKITSFVRDEAALRAEWKKGKR